MPNNLRELALEKLKDIPSEAYWPVGSHHAEEFEYQTGIDDIRKGLSEGVYDEKNWNWFLQYTRDLDRLRGTDTFKSIQEIKNGEVV